jgi:hypothetical protein
MLGKTFNFTNNRYNKTNYITVNEEEIKVVDTYFTANINELSKSKAIAYLLKRKWSPKDIIVKVGLNEKSGNQFVANVKAKMKT